MSNRFKKFVTALSCAACVVVLSACGSPKLDGSSDQALGESLVKVGTSLSEDKQKELGVAIGIITMAAGLEAASSGDINAVAADPTKGMREKVNGKTADEVIALAEELKAKLPPAPQ